jgi:hypothetical protein
VELSSLRQSLRKANPAQSDWLFDNELSKRVKHPKRVSDDQK